ncbi:hypothetical protein [Alteromonas facilis]|uniref:hypothetical protein n=1 Tax=Alteromonas facilis TaxID=2048004 RepID=UPI000C29001E|nr:hypothetical protein [Alteromonas facilis]
MNSDNSIAWFKQSSTAIASLFMVFSLAGCAPAESELPASPVDESTTITLDGLWIIEQDGQAMPDPQTSGLIQFGEHLMSISDGSALPEQRRRLHVINPITGVVEQKLGPMTMSSEVRRSCFSQYLSDEPDFEALVVDPDQPNAFIIVTEDATRTGAMSPRCQQRFENTGSTAYPTLLVRAELNGDKVRMTDVRPLQFPLELNVGDFPNDGIEGMAFGEERVLYLGLEKDAAGAARIFSLTIDDDFWQQDDFAVVEDPQLLLPEFPEGGNHPINGMDFLPLAGDHPGLLVAAARNDNQLWFVDLAKQQPTQVIDLLFNAPTLSEEPSCEAYELMDNASLEGVAVVGIDIYLVNDPWKKNYLKNVQCPSNEARYQAMAPLLFKLPIDPIWLSRYLN